MDTRTTKVQTKMEYERREVDVTPVMAAEFLKNLHPDQRAKKTTPVETYAEDMSNGDWRTDTEDCIMFDWLGRLIDGQLRLLAVVRSGKTIRFIVVWGVDPKVMLVKDTNAPRTITDSIRMSGRLRDLSGATQNVVTAIARQALHFENHRYLRGTQKGKATRAEIGRILDRQQDIIPAAYAAMNASKSDRPSLIHPSPYGIFYLLAGRKDSARLATWQDGWCDPRSLHGSSPIAVVRERLLANKMVKLSATPGRSRADQLTVDEMVALLIRAWNMHVRGAIITKGSLPISRGKLTNDNFPLPLSGTEVADGTEEASPNGRTTQRSGSRRAGNR